MPTSLINKDQLQTTSVKTKRYILNHLSTVVNSVLEEINSRTAHGVFSIAVNDWQTINDPDYGYCANISVSGLTTDDYAEINFTRSSLSVVAEAELCPSGETVADAIHIYAKNIPSTSITGEIFIHRGRELI